VKIVGARELIVIRADLNHEALPQGENVVKSGINLLVLSEFFKAPRY